MIKKQFLPPDLQLGDELREHVRDGRHLGKRRHMSDHRGEGSCQRSCQERAQPHVQLWHVQLLRTVRVPGSRKCKATENWKDHSFTQVGLPAKSGVSGIVLVVVPNVVGFATWSPPLDTIGNSARGVMFAEELVKIYNFHTFDSVTVKLLSISFLTSPSQIGEHTSDKKNPKVQNYEEQSLKLVQLLFAASQVSLLTDPTPKYHFGKTTKLPIPGRQDGLGESLPGWC